MTLSDKNPYEFEWKARKKNWIIINNHKIKSKSKAALLQKKKLKSADVRIDFSFGVYFCCIFFGFGLECEEEAKSVVYT